MSARKSGDFIADIEHQFEWYAANAGWEIAERYLDAVEAACRLLEQHPKLGPRAGLTHPKLRNWRFIVILGRFINTYYFMKRELMTYCYGVRCMATGIYPEN